ncbi:MAG: hypothetical protein ABSF13_01620 [Smithella sp.]
MEIRYENTFFSSPKGKRSVLLNITLTVAGLARGHIMCIFNTQERRTG